MQTRYPLKKSEMQAGCSERLVIKEFRACTDKVRKGVLVQPSLTDIFEWQVTFMPVEGPFADRIIAFFIVFENFPAAVPRVIFQKGFLHPLVNPSTSVFDCSEQFSEWNVQTRVYTLINFVCANLIDIPVPSKPQDPEATALVRAGTYRDRALRFLPDPPDPVASELNQPKRWGPQKERIAKILVAIETR